MIVETTVAYAFALRRALEDSDFRQGLSEFFETQALEWEQGASEAMSAIPPNAARATQLACMAKAYEEALNLLKAFIDKHLPKV